MYAICGTIFVFDAARTIKQRRTSNEKIYGVNCSQPFVSSNIAFKIRSSITHKKSWKDAKDNNLC